MYLIVKSCAAEKIITQKHTENKVIHSTEHSSSVFQCYGKGPRSAAVLVQNSDLFVENNVLYMKDFQNKKTRVGAVYITEQSRRFIAQEVMEENGITEYKNISDNSDISEGRSFIKELKKHFEPGFIFVRNRFRK